MQAIWDFIIKNKDAIATIGAAISAIFVVGGVIWPGIKAGFLRGWREKLRVDVGVFEVITDPAVLLPRLFATENDDRPLADHRLPYLPRDPNRDVQAELKRYDEAEAACRKAIELDPSNAMAYCNLGDTLNELKRYDEAEAAYRKAIEANPSFAIANFQLGNRLYRLKQYDETEAACRKAIELDPSNAMAYCNLGNTLNELKRYDEAEAACRKAIELDPSNAMAYCNLGNTLRRLSRYDEAEAAYRKAIELDPSDAVAYGSLAVLLRLSRRAEEAIPLLEQLIEMSPEDFGAYLEVISINKELGKGVANDYVTKVRLLIPEDDSYNRACFESVCDHLDLAFQYLEEAMNDGFDPAWAWIDADLQWLRSDPRFLAIVGRKLLSKK